MVQRVVKRRGIRGGRAARPAVPVEPFPWGREELADKARLLENLRRSAASAATDELRATFEQLAASVERELAGRRPTDAGPGTAAGGGGGQT